MGGNITCDDIQAFDILKLPFFCCHSFLTLNNKYSITLVYLSVYSKGGPQSVLCSFMNKKVLIVCSSMNLDLL